MRSIEKNRKQQSTYLPISIKLVGKIALVTLGFCLFGVGFIKILIILYLLRPILSSIFSVLVGFGAILLFIFTLMTFL